jgi:hypothetical protein
MQPAAGPHWRPSRRVSGFASMRRSIRIPLVTLLVLLVLAGGYAVYWRIVSGQIKQGLVAWQQSEKKNKIDASWQRLRVTGFPFAFRIEIDNATFRNHNWSPAPEIRLAHLSGAARPWDFADWRLTAPHGFAADLAPAAGRPAVKLAAVAADGSVTLGDHDASWFWLNARDVSGDAAGAVAIGSADMWVSMPPKPAAKDNDPSFGLAVAMRQVSVPAAPVNFGKTIDALAVGVTVKGALPAGPIAQAAAAWRDAGGTIEVNNLHVEWSGLGITANGTLALDHKLQPIAAFSSGIEGFNAILNALVAADQMTPEQASLVQIALTMLAKPGPDGKPQLTAPFTIQNGKIYLGPARLGTAPQIVWQ